MKWFQQLIITMGKEKTNMKKVLNWIFGILILVLLICCGLQFYYIKHLDSPECIYVTDTLIIRKDSIIEKIKYKTEFDTIIDLQYKDTIIHDTVKIPIEHKVDSFTIKKDSLTVTEKIHHSGFHSKIDSVELNYGFNYQIPKPKPKKFGWCITFGPSINYGITLDTQNKTWTNGPSAGFSIVIGPSYIIR